MEHIVRQYGLEQGALEVQYIEENFSEFRSRKMADEIIPRLADRECLILLSMAPASEDDDELIPVAFKVGHELKEFETQAEKFDPKRLREWSRQFGIDRFRAEFRGEVEKALEDHRRLTQPQ